jgi:hypothetical protein
MIWSCSFQSNFCGEKKLFSKTSTAFVVSKRDAQNKNPFITSTHISAKKKQLQALRVACSFVQLHTEREWRGWTSSMTFSKMQNRRTNYSRRITSFEKEIVSSVFLLFQSTNQRGHSQCT